MTRIACRLLVAVLTSTALLLGVAAPTYAMKAVSATPAVIAADIRAAAGPSDSPAPPSSDDLLLTPDTAGVVPVRQGNLTVWPNVQPGVSHAVRYVQGNNTQQFIHINGSEAPTSYTYRVRPGFTAKPGPNGSALLYDSADKLARAVPAPWAKDAKAKLVPAYFTVTDNGATLIKTVQHDQPGVNYPVVADPIVIWLAIAGAWFLTKCAVNGGREAAALRGQKWYVVVWGVGWVCVSSL